MVVFLAAGPLSASASARPEHASASANAGPSARLAASFAPDELGAATTVTFLLDIDPPSAASPPPLAGIDFSFPDNLGFETSGLGLAACNPTLLEAQGGRACPPDSRMGSGSATVVVAFGSDVVEEHATVELFAAPSTDGYVHLAILAQGAEPVQARIVITGELLEGHLRITVPVIPGLPDAPDVAVKQIRATLGGPLTYYEQAHGHTVAYRPKGIGLPEHCPRGGWRMGAKLTFQDGQRSQASTVVACPRGRGNRHG